MKHQTYSLLLILVGCSSVALAAQTPSSATTPISADRAVASAATRLEPTADGGALRHPRRTVEFAPDGVWLRPRGGAPDWRWSLQEITTSSGRPLVDPGPVAPVLVEQDLLRYDRCAVLEEYRLKVDTFEQLFVIPEPLALGGGDLVVSGSVNCDGDLAEADSGWAWRSARGEVTLGRVTVLDADGAPIPARFEVGATSTRIVVDGGALLTAAYPVVIDPEIGSNDYRISDMGGVGDPEYDAWCAAVAFNSLHNQYLVAWCGDDTTGGMVDNEYEIFVQVLDANGTPIGANDRRISYAGGTGSSSTGALTPSVAFNSVYNEYLVVWTADNPEDGCVDDEDEIWGQLVDQWGALIFGDAFRISFNGGSGDPAFSVFAPGVVYNPHADEYLVAWAGDHNAGGLVDDELEVWVQRVSSTGNLVGANLRISDMGGTGDPAYDASDEFIKLAFNSQDHEYLIVWAGDDNSGGLVDGEYEIYGQLVDETGSQIGPNDARLSDMGGTGNSAYTGFGPAVAYNPVANEYLVAWQGTDNVGGLVDGEWEIFCERLDSNLNTLGGNDVRVSDAGGIGNSQVDVQFGPAVAYNPAVDRYLVVWSGEDTVEGMVEDEQEVFAQALTSDIQEFGPNDERISDVGGLGDPEFIPWFPAVAANSTHGQFLVAWTGDDNVGGLVEDEDEVFIQRVYTSLSDIFADGFESGDTSRWTATVP